MREIVVVEFGHEVTSEEAVIQREGPVVILHEPWSGHFDCRDVVCLWSNAGRRELGLEDFDGRWGAGPRLTLVRGDSRAHGRLSSD